MRNFTKRAASLLTLLLCGACTVDAEHLPGVYPAAGLRNTCDTLRLLPGGRYVRHLYARNGRSLYTGRGTWKYAQGDLILYNYLLDDDREHLPEEVLGLGAMTCFLPVKMRWNETRVYYMPGESDAYYYKAQAN